MPQSLVRLLRKALPHIVALTLFGAVSALFFAPQYNGRALRQTDMVMFNGASSDIQQHIDRYGEHPQWAGRNFSGMPSYLISMNYDGRWVKRLADRFYLLGEPAAWIFVAMAGFYLMLLMFGVDPWLSIVGGLAYGLSSYFVIIIGAGHITKMMALAWAPPLVGSVRYAYRRARWLGSALAGLFAAVEISTSHPQITYYFLFVLLALVVNELVIAYKAQALARFGKTTATLALAAALAVGANIVQLYYVAQHTPETTRGRSELTDPSADRANRTDGLDRDYITAWSYGKLETLDLLVPNLYGGGRDFAPDGAVAKSLKRYDVPRGFERNLPSYWGPQPSTEGPVYLGASVIFLAVFGLLVLRGRQKWWIAAVAALALFLAWGRHMQWFTDLFIDYVPMYNKFRTVSMILVIVEWAVPLLAVLGLARLREPIDADRRPQLRKGWQWSLLAVGGLTLLIGLFGPMCSSFVGPSDGAMGLPEPILEAMRSERASLMRADAFRSLLFVALTAVAVWLHLNDRIKRPWFVAILCGIVLFDLFPVDKRYVSASDFQPKRQALTIPTTDADRQILQDTTDYRVANFTVNPFSDATTSYHHRSIGGYHAVKLQRYQDLIERHLGRQNMAVYDMLNTKYFILPGEGDRATVQQNPYACGSAWFVDSVAWVEGADAEIAVLTDFDPHTTAVVDRRFAPQLEGWAADTLPADPTAVIELTDYRVNRQLYRTRSDRERIAVLSEIYYPKGWTAILDGERADYFRADYVLRAIRIPAGEHTLEFRFAAPHFDLLVEITRACSALLLFGALGLLIGRTLRNRKHPSTDNDPSSHGTQH